MVLNSLINDLPVSVYVMSRWTNILDQVVQKKGSSSVPSAAPQVLWSSWRVVARHDDHQKMKSFLPRHGSWGNVPYLMRSGGATRIMAMWHVLISGVNTPIVWLLGFPLNFSFWA